MKDQVIMGPNGELMIAVPLFRHHIENEICALNGYSLSLTSAKPLAYVIDIGDGNRCPIFNAEVVEEKAEFLGDL